MISTFELKRQRRLHRLEKALIYAKRVRVARTVPQFHYTPEEYKATQGWWYKLKKWLKQKIYIV